ncbi:MAG: aminotransferase class I/II-fold pyridoxal phosphate-dependent enzyme [Bacteroidia bacterium]
MNKAVVGSQPLRNYLINFARPFIYSTALPPHTILSIKCAYELLPFLHEERKQVFHLSQLVQESWQKINEAKFIKANGPVQALIVPGNENVKILSNELQMADLDVRPILSPTVPAGSERLRLCLHAFNTEDEVDLLNSMIKAFFSKYIYGKENA